MDHQEGQTAQSSQRQECPDLWPPHLYTGGCLQMHYRTGKMLWSASFAFAFPVRDKSNIAVNNTNRVLNKEYILKYLVYQTLKWKKEK